MTSVDEDLAAMYDGKTGVYRNFTNSTVLAATMESLPPGGRVLDVGCASGGLLAELNGKASFRAGVELSSSAAARARLVADEVATMNATDEFPFPRDSFDVVVCADVLEHLADPVAGLRWISQWCRPGGTLVVSVPNVGNWQARVRLLRGRWDYEDFGLFDRGHLRFFTRRSIVETIRQAGLEIRSCTAARQPPVGMQIPAVYALPRTWARAVGLAWRMALNPLARRWPALFAYQLVCVARRGGT